MIHLHKYLFADNEHIGIICVTDVSDKYAPSRTPVIHSFGMGVPDLEIVSYMLFLVIS